MMLNQDIYLFNRVRNVPSLHCKLLTKTNTPSLRVIYILFNVICNYEYICTYFISQLMYMNEIW